jgi:pSer/pThr/pTyr-binding forkhead associated (FHA) protein
VNHGYLLLHANDPPRLLVPGRYSIGRALGCELRFDAPGLSRLHASVEVLPGRGVVIRDLGSTNGTFVDGERILKVALDGAALLRVGELDLVLRPLTGEATSEVLRPCVRAADDPG